MKKVFWIFLAVLMLCAASAVAESTLPEIHISGRYAYYLQDDGTAMIFRYLGDPGDGVFPPHEIDGYPASHDRDIGIGEYKPYFVNQNTPPFLYSLLEDGTAEICCYYGDPGQIPAVPETIDGFRVSRVNPYYEHGLKSSGMFDYFIRSDGTAEIFGLYVEDLIAFREGELLEIPEQLDGYPVTVLRSTALRSDIFRTTAFRISIPRTVTAIRSGTLPYARNFSEILVDKNNPVYTVKDDMLINRKENSIVCYAGHSTRTHIQIPDGIEEIHNNAFNISYNAVSVTIPDSVKRIGQDVFFANERVFKQLVIPATIEYMGNRAFRNVIGETLIITKGQRNDLIHGLKELFGGHDRYASNDALLSEPVSVNNHRSVDWSFVTDFDHVQIDADNEYLAYVNGCLYSKWNKELMKYLPQGEAETGIFTIPKGTASIAANAFSGCDFLTGVVIPKGVTSIGSGAFNSCDSLKSIVLPVGVTIIEDNTFASSGLESIVLPDGLVAIGDKAFRNCRVLESISIPDTVTAIGGAAFNNCTSLRSVVLPEGIDYIPRRAFAGCKALETVNIPASVTQIDKGAFDKCNPVYTVVPGTYGETWCQENGFNYVYAD